MKYQWKQKSQVYDESGQSLIIVAGAFIALLVIIGLAIDLGMVYVERIKIGKACDAAALAGAQELPFEDYAARRAMQYLEENGYTPQNTTITVTGPDNAAAIMSEWNSQNGQGGVRVIGSIRIECDQFEDKTLPLNEQDTSADKIRVTGRINVPMNFMRFVGFGDVPVSSGATAENVSNIDVTIVYDRSGSMRFNTMCWGCYSQPSGTIYPNGYRYRLPYDATFCNAAGDVPITTNLSGVAIPPVLSIEAEYFSYSTSYVEHDYHQNYLPVQNRTYWIIQRVSGSQASGFRPIAGDVYCGGSACPNDRRGAHMMLMPYYKDLASGHVLSTSSSASELAQAPRMDYDVTIPSTGAWYVWIRAQCGGWSGANTNQCLVHVGTDGTLRWVTGTGNFSNDSGYIGGDYSGSNSYKWRWVRLGSVNMSAGNHQVNVWGGGLGFRLDKIVLTTNTATEDTNYTDRAPAFIRDTTPSWTAVQNSAYQTYLYNSRYGGPPDTRGRTGFACSRCNPIYGETHNQDAACFPGATIGANNCQPGYPCCSDFNGNGKVDPAEQCNSIADVIYDDLQPIRASKEAAKGFVKRMKARFDQIGFVTFSSSATIDREQVCVKSMGYPPIDLGRGIYNLDPAEGPVGPDNAWTWCYDHRTSADGYSGSTPSTAVVGGSVMYAIEQMASDGSTNIANGLQLGLDVLSTQSDHYGRPNSAKIIVLMTDGESNHITGVEPACYAQDYYQPNTGDTTIDRAKDCVIYYSRLARDRNVVVYTIGLGSSADHALLGKAAELAGGMYFPAPSASDLDEIFQQIADQIFLRLVQ